MIKIICVGGEPCKKIINKCLQSVIDQTFNDWEMALVLDPGDYDIHIKDKRIKRWINSETMLGTANTVKAVSMINIDDEDIMVFIDADDWLLDENSLMKVLEVYEKYPDTLVTHGSWVSFPPRGKDRNPKGVNHPYSEAEFENIRGARWKGSALRTIKYKVFKLIKDKDLRNDNGEYFIGAERAIMFPALEMVGYNRVKFIKEVIYVYNVGYPRAPGDNRKECMVEFQQLIDRPPYERLP